MASVAEGCIVERPEGGREGLWLWATSFSRRGISPPLAIRGTLAGLSQPCPRSTRAKAHVLLFGLFMEEQWAETGQWQVWLCLGVSGCLQGEAVDTDIDVSVEARAVVCTVEGGAFPTSFLPLNTSRTKLPWWPRTVVVPVPPGRHLLPTWVSGQLEAERSSWVPARKFHIPASIFSSSFIKRQHFLTTQLLSPREVMPRAGVTELNTLLSCWEHSFTYALPASQSKTHSADVVGQGLWRLGTYTGFSWQTLRKITSAFWALVKFTLFLVSEVPSRSNIQFYQEAIADSYLTVKMEHL